MFGWLFGRKKSVEKLEEEIKNSFNSVKKDIKQAADWIMHLHSGHKNHENALTNFDERLSTIENDISEIKTFISFFNTRVSKRLSKHPQTLFNKQTAVEGVQTPVQTAVQTAFLGNLSVMERAIIWILLNAGENMKLSCEDIATITGKEKSTIRGQINSIKQKSEGLIEEAIEKSGKKRFYMPEKVREMLLRKAKLSKKKARKRKSES